MSLLEGTFCSAPLYDSERGEKAIHRKAPLKWGGNRTTRQVRNMPHDSNIITIYQSWAGKIFIQAPMREQQALDIASLIKEGHIVVLNLERCGSVESQKLLDFISGAAYAREYKMNKIAVSTCLIAPPEVAIISLID